MITDLWIAVVIPPSVKLKMPERQGAMNSEDDSQLKRIQKILDASPDALEPLKRIRTILDATAIVTPDELARTLANAPKFSGGDAGMVCAADAYGLWPSMPEMARGANLKAVEMAKRARREAPLRRAAEQLAFEQELERLRRELKTRGDGVHPAAGISDSLPAAPGPAAVKVTAAQETGRVGASLRQLKSEANLTWDTIAKESGVSRRWLLGIAAGAEPGAETAKSLDGYFSRILKRPVQL